MAWKCPACSRYNDDSLIDCSCGYAFYKVLGVKPDAKDEEIKRTYEYLLKVWDPAGFSHDAGLQKKAEERLKKIKEAYKNYRHYSSGLPDSKEKIKLIKLSSFAVIFLLLSLSLILFLQKDKSKEKIITQPSILQSLPQEQTTKQPEATKPPADLSLNKEAIQENLPADISTEKAEERVVEMAKKSHALDRLFDVEAIIKKWTDDNSDKLQAIGWKARKIDELTYLVSYTASDGFVTKGFYFDVNIGTGKVQNIGNDPELQKKYGIQYGQ